VTVVWATPGGEELEHAGAAIALDNRTVAFRGTLDGLYQWSKESGYAFEPPPVRALARALGANDRVADMSQLAGWIGEAFRAVDAAPADPPAIDSPTSLRLESVSFSYGDTPVFDNLSLTVRRGEVVGLSGINASGKSTLLLLAAGVHKPSAGKLERDAARAFLLPQTPEDLFFAETVREELTFGLKRAGVAKEESQTRAAASLRTVGLDPEAFLDRFPFHLSLGEMRRVAFAVARVMEPELLLLDEPTSCLDTSGITALRELITEERKRETTVIVASHDVSLLCEVCDRVVVVGKGHALADIDVRFGRVAEDARWPRQHAPLVVALQNALAADGLRIDPPAASPSALLARLRA
jgi:energy-coupling factor transporter ATP-binding protein EcfA2